MVHRQILSAHLLTAVVANALLQLGAPPDRLAQLPRCYALAMHVLGVGVQVKPIFP